MALMLFVPGSRSGATARTSQMQTNAGSQELSRRVEAQRAAVQSANPQTISEASEKLIALALRQMGEWRAQQKAYPQADRTLSKFPYCWKTVRKLAPI